MCKFNVLIEKSRYPNNNFLISDSRYREDENQQQVIPSMPSVYRFGLKKLIEHLHPLIEIGLNSILLFGVVDNLPKVTFSHLKIELGIVMKRLLFHFRMNMDHMQILI